MDLLLIKDCKDVMAGFGRALQGAGHDVETVVGYAEALALFRHNYFDMVLCDMSLPDGDGCDLLCEMLKIRPVKAIAMMDHGVKWDQERCKHAGFVTHVAKPIDVDGLLEVLRDVDEGRYEFPFFGDDGLNLSEANH